MSDQTLRVRFDPPATPPAILVVDDVTIAAGDEHDLPADIAQTLIDNPVMNVLLASDAPSAGQLNPSAGQLNAPETGDTKED